MNSDFFKSFKMNKNLQNAIFLILGILLLFFPSNILNTFSILIGVVILVYGIWGALGFILNYKDFSRDANRILTFVINIVSIIIAISIFANPAWVISVLYIIVGAIVIANGIKNIVELVVAKSENRKMTLVFLIISALLIILGVVIIAHPQGIANFIVRLEGLSLIINAVNNWIMLYKLEHN